MLNRIILATRNKGKEVEFIYLLTRPDIPELEILQLPEDIPEVPEVMNSYSGNAIMKAVTIANFTGIWALGEDCGLEVLALDGRPGVYSHRYGATTEERQQRLLAELEGEKNRTATFFSVVVISSPQGEIYKATGSVTGTIATSLRGESGPGMGYDSLFIPYGCDKTLAELSIKEKCQVSHRACAFNGVKAQIWKR